VTAGGLLLDGAGFRHVNEKFLFPDYALGELLRGKMLDALRELQAKGSFPELSRAAFDELMASLAQHKRWVVHTEPAFRNADHLLGYLGRYVHRIAISDSRLMEVTPNRVVFGTKDGKTACLHPVTFLHRFVQHVLPQGFHKVRHGGLYARTSVGGRLDQARALLEQEPIPEEPKDLVEDSVEDVEEVEKPAYQGHRCPDCNGPLEKTNVLIPRPRSPPGGAIA
jgi:hypothetical protein